MNNEHERIDDEGRISEHSRPLGTVTLEMVQDRAREIAIINGRAPNEVSEADVAQARRELTMTEEMPPDQAVLESMPESERWDPVPGSFGHRARTLPPQDEQTENERFVEEGMSDAEHDQMVKGTRQSEEEDEEG